MRLAAPAIAVLLLLSASGQILFFFPLTTGNRSADLGLFRIDGLSVVFGAIWTIAPALRLFIRKEWVFSSLLLGIGLPGMAYAREPFVFALGWMLVGVGAFLTAKSTSSRASYMQAAAIFGPAIMVLLAWIVGVVESFAPPAGGVSREWPLAGALMVGVAACAGSVGGLFVERKSPTDASSGLMPIFAVSGPFVLAKMLVGGRWDAWGTWSLALMGTIALLAFMLWSIKEGTHPNGIVSALALLSVIAFALASLSPVAALGGVWLMVIAAIVTPIEDRRAWPRYAQPLIVAGAMVGLWLLASGALAARFGLIAVITLPVALLAAAMLRGSEGIEREPNNNVGKSQFGGGVLVIALLIVGAIYPQGIVEWVARPAVEAMSGGVSAPTALTRNWGIGLQVISPPELLLAALPATGIAVAVFLAWALLYWANLIAKRLKP